MCHFLLTVLFYPPDMSVQTKETLQLHLKSLHNSSLKNPRILSDPDFDKTASEFDQWICKALI